MEEDNLIKEIHQFISNVYAMRKAQQRYFRTRSRGALTESKHFEKQVDSWIENRFDNGIKQMEFFNNVK